MVQRIDQTSQTWATNLGCGIRSRSAEDREHCDLQITQVTHHLRDYTESALIVIRMCKRRQALDTNQTQSVQDVNIHDFVEGRHDLN